MEALRLSLQTIPQRLRFLVWAPISARLAFWLQEKGQLRSERSRIVCCIQFRVRNSSKYFLDILFKKSFCVLWATRGYRQRTRKIYSKQGETIQIKVQYQVFLTIQRTTLRLVRWKICKKSILFPFWNETQYRLKRRYKSRKSDCDGGWRVSTATLSTSS